MRRASKDDRSSGIIARSHTLLLPRNGEAESHGGRVATKGCAPRLVLLLSVILVSLVAAGCGYDTSLAGNGITGAQSTMSSVANSPSAPGLVVSRVSNTADLDQETLVISVPLGVRFEAPGRLYGALTKKPVQLGPSRVEGMTQDGLGSQAGILLSDKRYVIYPFWQKIAEFPSEAPNEPSVANGTRIATPTIRRLDLQTGEDTLVATGARSMAWRADGTFAYAKGVDADYRYNTPYLQRVLVQKGLDGRPEAWTSDADRYTVVAWVKDSLLVWREFEGEGGELLVLDGPDRVRRILGEGERFLAAGPDGEYILTALGADVGACVIRLVDWETGLEVARLALEGMLDPVTGTAISAVSDAAWERNTVVAALSPADLAVISAANGSLMLEKIITFEYANVRPGGIRELVLDDTGRVVQAVTSEGPRGAELETTAVITYDLLSGDCSRWICPDGRAVMRLVGNPSRPR